MGGPIFLVWSFAPLTILLVIAAFSVRAIWVTITPPRKGVKQPSCEKCKYPVAGLTALNCPECGSDLRQTGIITRPMEIRRRGGLGGALLGLTFLMATALGIAMLTLTSLVAPNVATAASSSLPSTTLTPFSGAYTSLVVEQTYGSALSTASNQTFTAALVLSLADGTTHRLEVTPARACTPISNGAAGGPIGSLSYRTIASWFGSCGLDTSNPAIAVEAEEATRILDISAITPYTPPSQMSLSGFKVGPTTYPTVTPLAVTDRPALWNALAWAIPLLGFALWVVFTLLIVVRRRRLLREADAPAHSPSPVLPA